MLFKAVFIKYIIFPLLTIMLFYSKSFSQINIEFTEYGLNNGLHVILHKDNTNPIVSVDIWYHVGSKDEDTGRTGFAHLFEHMMFQGSEHVKKAEHFKYIQKVGGTLNGSTSQDRTNYFETVPSNQLELVLWLESDRMSTLNVTQDNFDNQREVVKEEKRQRYDNVPYGNRFNKLFASMFQNHPYHWMPIGSMQDLNDADLQYAQEFYKRFYAPDNAVLVISGDFDTEQAKALVEKYFSNLKSSNFKRKNYPANLFDQGEKDDTLHENVQLPAMYEAYKMPAITDNDLYALHLLSLILSDGASSRLYKKVIYETKSAKSVSTFPWALELSGLFVISSTGLKDTELGSLKKMIDEEINEVKEHGVTEQELQKSKNVIETQYVNRMQTNIGIADQLAYYYTYFRNTGMINTALDKYLQVNNKDIMNVADKYLSKDNRAVLFYFPVNKN